MKTRSLKLTALLGLSSFFSPSLLAAETAPDFTGKLDFSLNTRLEMVDQTNLRDAQALTFGSDLGYTISYRDTFKVSAQLENTTALDGDAYNQAGLNPGGAGRAVVADPEITELNQLWVSAKYDIIDAKLGRQIIIYDNARFVGNVGWRQNMQTFDAARISIVAPDFKIKFDYAYLDQILLIFGRDHPAGEWDSDSHLVHLQWQARPDLTITGYSYLLDFDNARANSSATTGIALTGKRALTVATTAEYRFEFAQQTDYGSSPLNYEADYWCLEAGITHQGWTFLAGYEDLGSNRGVGFKTPLATGHAFNGWADLFLATPGNGLADRYGKIATSFQKIKMAVVYHDFVSSDGGAAFGREIDFSAARKINDAFSVLLKFADFESKSARPDATKFWSQAVYTY